VIRQTTKHEGAELERLSKLVQRAELGDVTALPELREAMYQDHTLWDQFGDLAQHAEQAWLTFITGSDLNLREAVEHKLEDLKKELLEAGDSVMERLLVERVLACWLQVNHADIRFAQSKDSFTPIVHAMLQKRQTAAQNRYHRAIHALLTARKLLIVPRSPVEIATRLSGESSAVQRGRRRTAGLALPMMN
jgi:hypothetical protein